MRLRLTSADMTDGQFLCTSNIGHAPRRKPATSRFGLADKTVIQLVS